MSLNSIVVWLSLPCGLVPVVKVGTRHPHPPAGAVVSPGRAPCGTPVSQGPPPPLQECIGRGGPPPPPGRPAYAQPVSP